MQSQILGIPINILLDTEASCNVLCKEIFDKLKLQYPGIKLDVCGVEHTRLRSFCGSDTCINGKITANTYWRTVILSGGISSQGTPNWSDSWSKVPKTFDKVIFNYSNNCIKL